MEKTLGNASGRSSGAANYTPLAKDSREKLKKNIDSLRSTLDSKMHAEYEKAGAAERYDILSRAAINPLVKTHFAEAAARQRQLDEENAARQKELELSLAAEQAEIDASPLTTELEASVLESAFAAGPTLGKQIAEIAMPFFRACVRIPGAVLSSHWVTGTLWIELFVITLIWMFLSCMYLAGILAIVAFLILGCFFYLDTKSNSKDTSANLCVSAPVRYSGAGIFTALLFVLFFVQCPTVGNMFQVIAKDGKVARIDLGEPSSMLVLRKAARVFEGERVVRWTASTNPLFGETFERTATFKLGFMAGHFSISAEKAIDWEAVKSLEGKYWVDLDQLSAEMKTKYDTAFEEIYEISKTDPKTDVQKLATEKLGAVKNGYYSLKNIKVK